MALNKDYYYLHVGRASDLDLKAERRLYRLFEILPGLLAWLTFALVVVLSFKAPVLMAFFIIAFDVYWLVKTIYLSLHLRISYRKLKDNLRINWLKKLELLPTTEYKNKEIRSWEEIYHLVLLPIYKENYAVISTSLEAILKSNYPKSKMIVALCYEERAGQETEETINKIKEAYEGTFFRFTTIKHPADLEGELPGKGSNTNYGVGIVKKEIIDSLAINYDQILVSNFDVDTVCYPEYFAILTYTFVTTENALRASYQPVPLYVNNIWEAPSFARVVAFAATFWHTIKQEKSETATTFSSHSMPFRALIDVDLWQKNMVSEDSRIFWQCFLRYDGDYRVVPLYYPVSMDANVAGSNWQTLKNVYKQQRRWAYGAENVPYFLFGFWKNKLIPRAKKWYYGFIVAEGNHSWATNAVLLFALGWLPVIVGGQAFNQTVLSFNLPYLTRWILTLSTFGLISSAILSITLLPPRPIKYGKMKYLWMLIQWILFPATTIFLGAIPAIDAQTRLMLGKYMGFWVTPKTREITQNE
jgi:cellulose synthase/poly-beta-1,6-N-acetylglucosamine synthase-like glycosyltransferase